MGRHVAIAAQRRRPHARNLQKTRTARSSQNFGGGGGRGEEGGRAPVAQWRSRAISVSPVRWSLAVQESAGFIAVPCLQVHSFEDVNQTRHLEEVAQLCIGEG